MMPFVPRQLLVREDEQGREHVESVPNPSGQPPEAVESPSKGLYAPVLGTMDLLELARALSARGYRPVHLELRDSGFRELPFDDDQDLQQLALDQLRQGHSATAIFNRNIEFLTVAVIEAELADKTGLRVRLLRNGAFFADSSLDLKAFTGSLIEAWHEVRGM